MVAYRVYISTTDDDQCRMYLQAAQAALFRLNEFPITAQTSGDLALPGQRRVDAARRAIDNAHFFIGIYGGNYGSIPQGYTESHIELEFRYARARNIPRLLFILQGAQSNGDERLKDFARELAETHVLNVFTDADSLQAQVVMAVENYRRTAGVRKRLLPPSQRFRGSPPPNAASAPPPPTSEEIRLEDAVFADQTDAVMSGDTLEQTVDRALAFAADDIEQILRRALELHDAGKQTQPTYDGWLQVNPIFGPPLQQSQFQADIFMITPFRPQYDAVYQNVIVPTVAALNLTIKRGDDFSSISGSIIQEVWAAIYACRVVIVETTEINANVYYELGIAHTLGKPAILITQETDIEKWPFDIRHRRFIVYENTIPGGEKLEADLRRSLIWTLNSLDEQQGNGA